jgi:protein-export membrane protein SecD
MLAIFKLIPVTLTAAGIAGFILSIGMAVDANILIFERMKEELKKGKDLSDAMHDGFQRAWLSIRDSNISSMISAVILFWFGTSLVKGFALTLGLGVLVSMFSAITVTRTFLYSLGTHGKGRAIRFFFGSGVN